jgi:hypothetical protein
MHTNLKVGLLEFLYLVVRIPTEVVPYPNRHANEIAAARMLNLMKAAKNIAPMHVTIVEFTGTFVLGFTLFRPLHINPSSESDIKILGWPSRHTNVVVVSPIIAPIDIIIES